MTSRYALVAALVLAPLAAMPLGAQQSSGSPMREQRDTTGAKAPVASGASSDSALVDLGRAITALAVSVQAAVTEAAKNPEMRRAAAQTAGSAVSVAQRALAENTGEIERLLAEASRKLAEIEAEQKRKAKAPATP